MNHGKPWSVQDRDMVNHAISLAIYDLSKKLDRSVHAIECYIVKAYEPSCNTELAQSQSQSQSQLQFKLDRMAQKAELSNLPEQLRNKLSASLASRTSEDIYKCALACIPDGDEALLVAYNITVAKLETRITKTERVRLIYLRNMYIKTIREILSTNNQDKVLLWLAIK